MAEIDLTEDNAFIKSESQQRFENNIGHLTILSLGNTVRDNKEDLTMDNDQHFIDKCHICHTCGRVTNPISDFENIIIAGNLNGIFKCRDCKAMEKQDDRKYLEIKSNDTRMEFNLLSVLM